MAVGTSSCQRNSLLYDHLSKHAATDTQPLCHHSDMHWRQWQSKSTRLILFISIVDVYGAFASIPYILQFKFFSFVNKCWQKITIIALWSSGIILSGYLLVIVGIDRFLHIKYRNSYTTKLTNRRYNSILCAGVFALIWHLLWTFIGDTRVGVSLQIAPLFLFYIVTLVTVRKKQKFSYFRTTLFSEMTTNSYRKNLIFEFTKSFQKAPMGFLK